MTLCFEKKPKLLCLLFTLVFFVQQIPILCFNSNAIESSPEIGQPSCFTSDGSYTVSKSGYYQIELWGGKGGNGANVSYNSKSQVGGKGSIVKVSGVVHVNVGDVINFSLGSNGSDGSGQDSQSYLIYRLYYGNKGNGGTHSTVTLNSSSNVIAIAGGGGGGSGAIIGSWGVNLEDGNDGSTSDLNSSSYDGAAPTQSFINDGFGSYSPANGGRIGNSSIGSLISYQGFTTSTVATVPVSSSDVYSAQIIITPVEFDLIVSVSIDWDSLDFTVTSAVWNPETHTYDNCAYSPSGSNLPKVTITNNTDSTTDIDASVVFSSETNIGDLSCSVSNGVISSLSPGSGSESAIISVTGSPPSVWFLDDSPHTIGTITVTITKSITP